jgi:hypothetical protein
MTLNTFARSPLRSLAVSSLWLVCACGDEPRERAHEGGIPHEAGAPSADTAVPQNVGTTRDASTLSDARPPADAAPGQDATKPEDTGIPLVLPEVDAMVLPDGGKSCYTPPFGSIELTPESVAALEGCDVLRGDLRMGDHFGETRALFPASLRVVEGTLNFFRNPQLADLSALRNLTSVGRLLIHHNERLETLSGLERLRSVRSELFISSNPLLRSLAALSSLETVGEEIRFGSNDALPLSELDRLRAQVRVVPYDAGL